MTVLLRAYNPDQPRADDGKWTAGAYSSGGKYESHHARISAATKLEWDSLAVFHDRVYEVFGGQYSPKLQRAVHAMEQHQKGTYTLDDKKTRKAMDRAFKYAAVELKQDAIVYRGMHMPSQLLSKLQAAADRKSRVYLQQNKIRYVPTSVSKQVAAEFGDVQLRIFLPKGTRVLAPSMVTHKFRDEREVTLNRGARFRVVSGRTHTSFYGEHKATLTLEYVGAVHNKKSHLGKVDIRRLSKQLEQDRDDHFTGDVEYIEIDDEIVYGERVDDEDDLIDGDEALKAATLVDLRRYFTRGDRVHDYERAGYKKKSRCEHCGSTKNLIVHHKDHDHSNNGKGNHETICRTCHSREHADQKRKKDGRYGSGTKMQISELQRYFVQSPSATSGLTAYDLDGQRRTRVRRRPKRTRLLISGKGRAQTFNQGEKR